jgi:hypothetical protein
MFKKLTIASFFLVVVACGGGDSQKNSDQFWLFIENAELDTNVTQNEAQANLANYLRAEVDGAMFILEDMGIDSLNTVPYCAERAIVYSRTAYMLRTPDGKDPISLDQVVPLVYESLEAWEFLLDDVQEAVAGESVDEPNAQGCDNAWKNVHVGVFYDLWPDDQ